MAMGEGQEDNKEREKGKQACPTSEKIRDRGIAI